MDDEKVHNTGRSKAIFEKACEVIPGGVTANIKYIAPRPLVMEKGSGSKLFDVDGNEYIDYLLCYGALITGHGHEKIVAAVYKQLQESGTTVFGTPHLLETTMAQKLIALYPGIEMVRYTNSGLEATLLAVRAAMGFTGKPKLAKFEGHYHGGYDQVLFSVNPDPNEAGPSDKPKALPESKGIPDYYAENTIVLPFNNLDATEQILKAQAHELAAVILEPVQGGFIPAEKEFIEGLRKITAELGILLIFDEVKTGFRVSLGGAQKYYGVTPDLTALGKVIGGGFPIGVVGGRREIMNTMAPTNGRDILTAGADTSKKADVVFHSGTFNGHPTVLAAGMATVELIEQQGVLDSLHEKTQSLRNQLESLYRSRGVPMQTIGLGSIFNIILDDGKIRNYRDMSRAKTKLRKEIDEQLWKFGVYIKPLNRYSMSIAHSEEDIARTVEAHERALKKVL